MLEGVTKLAIPTPFRVGAVNCYLLEGDPLTLIDTGPNDEDSLAALEAGLGELNRTVEDLELLILTHQHYDHVGLAAALKKRSGAKVAAHELLAGFVADYEAAMIFEDDYAAALMGLHGVPDKTSTALQERSRSYRRYAASVEIDHVLREGDVIDAGQRSLTVALRPGHSPTDTIFIDTGAWSAFVGDHLLGHISSNPVLHRPLDHEADPRRRRPTLIRYLASMEETAKLDLEELFPGHGENITYCRDLVYERGQHHEERKEHIFAEFEKGPRTANDIALRLWPGLPLDQAYLALSEVLGHVDMLVDEGRVVEEESAGVITLRATG